MRGRFVTALVTLSLGLLLCSTAHGSAQYTIKKGDTLQRVARKLNVPVSQIQRANSHVDARHIKPGMKITIPSKPAARKANGRKTTPREAAEKKPANHEETARKTQEAATTPVADIERKPEATYHTVMKGDTLSSISRTYGISASELKELNNLKLTKLRRGQKLLVRHIGPKTYTVKKGDNISRIAKRFDMDVQDLMTLNEMDSPTLKAGHVLYLEEAVDASAAPVYNEAIVKGVEEEIRTLAESEEFREQESPDKLVTFAKKLLNIPYRFGGNSILGIDCSAYVKKVYGFLGIDLPRTAREQFKEGEKVEREELSIGDLVFFRTYASFPSHVGIYLGNDLFIHASSKGKRVTINSLETPYYLKRFIGGKRVLTEGEKDPEQTQG